MKNQIILAVAVVTAGLITGCANNEAYNDDRAMANDGWAIQESSGAATTPAMGTEFNELPAAVQKAIKSHAANAKIEDIDKERRTGRVIYEVEFSEPGKNPKLHVAEDGTIVDAAGLRETAEATKSRLGTEFNELPAAVQKAIKEKAPNAQIDDIDKERRTGRVVYEVQFAEPGQNPKLHIAEDGTVLSAE